MVTALNVGDTITKTWVDEVSDGLNALPDLDEGQFTSSPDGDGLFSFTFPTPFASPPIISLEIVVATSANEYTVFPTSVTATGFTARQHINGAAMTSGRAIQWKARGTFA